MTAVRIQLGTTTTRERCGDCPFLHNDHTHDWYRVCNLFRAFTGYAESVRLDEESDATTANRLPQCVALGEM